jgi:hypothetical protein
MASWLCHEYKSTDPVVRGILDACGAHLYLLYFGGGLNQQNQAWTMDDANDQWREMSSCYSQEHRVTMNPLCSATLGLSQGGLNWRNLTLNQADQGVFIGGTHMPYAMWCLSKVELPPEYAGQHEGNANRLRLDDLRRFTFQDNQIVPVLNGGQEHRNILAGFKNTMQRCVLAQAVAMQWVFRQEDEQVWFRQLASLESDG